MCIRDRYNGVAQFFRAYFYFVKVRRYGDVPWYDQVLGSEDQELLAKARDSREFVMDRVLKDFEDAATSLPTKSTDTRNTRVTKWAALAFASQAALYEGTCLLYTSYHRIDTVAFKGFSKSENQQARCSAGLAVVFRTNSPQIDLLPSYKWEYRKDNVTGIAAAVSIR